MLETIFYKKKQHDTSKHLTSFSDYYLGMPISKYFISSNATSYDIGFIQNNKIIPSNSKDIY